MPDRILGPTRRQIVSNLGLAAGAVGLAATLRSETFPETTPVSANATRTSLHQEVDLPVPPARIEAVLLDAKQFAAFSKMPATIDPHEGGAFSMFGGMIVGRNVELVSGQRVVQAWRPTHWDPGVYSMVKFDLQASGSGCKVVLDHTGFPAGDYDSLSDGWVSHYWNPLKTYFAG